jgi:hypothetical protein
MNKDDVRLIADQCFVDRRNNVLPTKTFMGNDDELQNFAARLEAEWMKDAEPVFEVGFGWLKTKRGNMAP